ncbi:unnamed protein product [Aspergillus oryzae]|uniref:Unnamed protein product n=1 Tax=Aspergillus oryzae TaxID=5062 RepID=A0AAN5BSF6_ASPOZ|nr:unnamed protein product [Aspergillus oryzae]
MGALRRIKTKRRTRSELISNPPNTSRSTKPPRTPRIYQDSESITALSAQNGLRVNITWLPTRRKVAEAAVGLGTDNGLRSEGTVVDMEE